jgi:hypothetical protein
MATPYPDMQAVVRHNGSLAHMLFFFDSMLTPKIITFVYWLLLAASLIGGIGSMFAFRGVTFVSFMTGIGIIVGGALGARIWCELLMVLFKINEHTQKMAERS